MPSERSRRATLPQRQTWSVGLAAVEGRHDAQRRPRLPDAAQQAHGLLRGAHGRARHAVLELLRAPAARDPVVLALQVPGHGGLERLLVRARAPAELAARLGRAVGPPLARGADLVRRQRPGPAGGGEHAGGRARGRGGQLDRRLHAGEAAEVREQAVEREVAPAEDVALPHRAEPSASRWPSATSFTSTTFTAPSV